MRVRPGPPGDRRFDTTHRGIPPPVSRVEPLWMRSDERGDYLAVLNRLRRVLRIGAYSHKTEEAYYSWARRFLRFVEPLPVEAIGVEHVAQFVDQQRECSLAPTSRNQAASALTFLLKEILGIEDVRSVPRAKEARRMASVLSPREVERVFTHLSGKYRLIGMTIYGTGARVSEASALRVKDIDFDLMQVAIRGGKGNKDRWTLLPDRIRPALQRQVERVHQVHRDDRKRGGGWVSLPDALHRKDPKAGFRLGWQFLFPASRWTVDEKTERSGRYHLHKSAVQRQVKRAGIAAGIAKSVTPHVLRRTFATEMFRAGCDPSTLMNLLGHNDIRTTMRYIRPVTDAGQHLKSPLDLPVRD
jgi:integron integrase